VSNRILRLKQIVIPSKPERSTGARWNPAVYPSLGRYSID
jgi:hypothetical protein